MPIFESLMLYMKRICLLLIYLLIGCVSSFAQLNLRQAINEPTVKTSDDSFAGSGAHRASGIFEEGFEGYEDFTLDLSEWTTLDLDGRPTWGIENATFPHQFEAMSFIVFNPSATNPPMLNDGIKPHSGSKIAACFSANGTINNDWLISPPLLAGSNTSVSFYVKSYTSKFGLERYRVGISNTDTKPESFTILSGTNYFTAPDKDWQQKVFDLNAYNGQTIYIGIHCVSNQAFIFMVDDFRFSTVLPDYTTLSGQVSNALNGQPVSGAEVCIAGRCTFTDSFGNYTIDQIPSGILMPAFGAMPTYGGAPLTVKFNDESKENTHTVSCSKQGYLTYVNNQVDLPPGRTLNLNMSLSPELQEGNVRFVLNWGALPTDLDSHLLTPEINGSAHHVYFDNRGSATSVPFAKLDYDITSGFGPETMTIYERRPGTYRYYVRNYSENSPISSSNAVVQVYGVGGLLHTIQVPSSGNGNYWYVCDVNGQTGDIVIKNNILDFPPPLFKNLPMKKEDEMAGIRYINSWVWDFGDGTTSSLKNPVHTYIKEGSYNVSLTIYDGASQEMLLKEAYIQVGAQSIEELPDRDSQIRFVQLPGSNELKIVSPQEITNLRIIDLSGMVRFNRAFDTKEIILGIAFLNQGIYILEIETRSGCYRRKFSKW